MAKFTYIKQLNGYEINLKILCSYDENYFINEFDSHDMTDFIESVFNDLEEKDHDEIQKKEGAYFINVSKYLFNRINLLHSVEFVSKKTKSEYFIEDIKGNDK